MFVPLPFFDIQPHAPRDTHNTMTMTLRMGKVLSKARARSACQESRGSRLASCARGAAVRRGYFFDAACVASLISSCACLIRSLAFFACPPRSNSFATWAASSLAYAWAHSRSAAARLGWLYLPPSFFWATASPTGAAKASARTRSRLVMIGSLPHARMRFSDPWFDSAAIDGGMSRRGGEELRPGHQRPLARRPRDLRVRRQQCRHPDLRDRGGRHLQ